MVPVPPGPRRVTPGPVMAPSVHVRLAAMVARLVPPRAPPERVRLVRTLAVSTLKVPLLMVAACQAWLERRPTTGPLTVTDPGPARVPVRVCEALPKKLSVAPPARAKFPLCCDAVLKAPREIGRAHV